VTVEATLDGPVRTAEQARSRQAPAWVLVTVLALILVVSAYEHWKLMTQSGTIFDLDAFRVQGQAALSRHNAYFTGIYPYPPVWLWIMALAIVVSEHLHLAWLIVARVPGVTGDLALIVLLFIYARQRLGSSLMTLLPSALFGLSPTTFLIGGAHGQFDSLVMAFVLAAIVVRGRDQDDHPLPAALLLGIAIALKGFPVLFLPYLVMSTGRGRRLAATVVALLPLIVASLVYVAVVGYDSAMLRAILLYRSGAFDFGWGYLTTIGVKVPHASLLESAGRVLEVGGAFIVPLLLDRRRPATVLLVVMAVFMASTEVLNVQYLMWAQPLVCATFPVEAVLYMGAWLPGALSLYYIYFRSVLPPGPHWSFLYRHLVGPRWWLGSVIAIMVVSAVIALRGLVEAWAPLSALREGRLLRRSPNLVSLDRPQSQAG
jgi:hypothetical protein